MMEFLNRRRPERKGLLSRIHPMKIQIPPHSSGQTRRPCFLTRPPDAEAVHRDPVTAEPLPFRPTAFVLAFVPLVELPEPEPHSCHPTDGRRERQPSPQPPLRSNERTLEPETEEHSPPPERSGCVDSGHSGQSD